MATAISELTGEPVDTASQAWMHECEVRHILDGFPSKEARNIYLFGGTTPNGRKVRGIAGHRGKAAADKLKDDVLRLYRARKARADAS